MRKIWAKSILLGSGIITMMGISTPLVQATAQHDKQISEVRQTTPLYLRLSTGLPSNSDKQEPNTKTPIALAPKK
jgi:hypothetical protein